MRDTPPCISRPKRVLAIGSNNTPPYCEVIPFLKVLGYDVFTVGPSRRGFTCDLNLENIPSKTKQLADRFCGMGVNMVGQIYEYKLESLLDILNTIKFDFIIQFQDWEFFTDKRKSPIPFFYIASEGWYPYIPDVAWMTFCSYAVTAQVFRAYYPYNKIELWYTGVVNGLLVDNPFDHERTIPCSFAGNIYNFKELYEDRRTVCKYLAQFPEIFQGHWNKKPTCKEDENIPECGKGRVVGSEYLSMLLNSKIGLNVSSYGLNFRDFEICATGAMLLALKTTDHTNVGFIDGENCVFYTDEKDAKEKIEYYLEHDDLRKDIAKKGYLLIRDNYTYQKRTVALIDRIEEYLKGWGR